MKVLWTPRAADDLDEIYEFIHADNPDAADRVVNKIYDAVMSRAKMPETGRIGELVDTREIVFQPWPYIAVYRISEGAMRIIRIRHASQKWPE